MENMTKEQELTEAEKFLIKKSQECPPFTHDGLNQLPYILVSAVAKCMEEFVQFSLYKDHPATASGSVAAPKGEMHLRHKLELGREIDSLRQQLEQKTIALDSYYKLAAEAAPIKEALTETTEKLMESVSMLDIIRDDMTRDDTPTSGYESTDWSIVAMNDLIQSSQAIIDRVRKLISK